MSVKKYTEKQLKDMDDGADGALILMTEGAVVIGFLPVMVDIGVLMTAMGAGVVSIGKCYGCALTKGDAGELIKQFFKAAGMTFSFIFAGQKIVASLLKSNPATYLPTMIADATMCGATAYAVGSTAKKYFRHMAEGRKATAEDIKHWMEDGKKEGKSVAKQQAEDHAKEKGYK